MSQSRRIELPFADWPRSEVVGNGAIRLAGICEKAGSDFRAKLLGYACGVLLLLVAPASCGTIQDKYYGGDMPVEPALYILGGSTVACFLVWLILYLLTSCRKLNVIISRDHITINGRNYAWLDGTQIGIEPHEKAVRLKEFQDAMQVVMRYGERRVVIADFPFTQRDKAQALMRRMQIIFRSIGNLSDSGGEAIGVGTRDDFKPERPIR
jgi:hypothetical protein